MTWFNCSSNTTNEWTIVRIYRWLFRCCMDCGVKLGERGSRGEVCPKCFDEFDGMTIEELMQ